eukprot:6113481-Prymnesium_polylepis.1
MPIRDSSFVLAVRQAAESTTRTRSSPNDRVGGWGVVWRALVASSRNVPRLPAILCILHEIMRRSGRVLWRAA